MRENKTEIIVNQIEEGEKNMISGSLEKSTLDQEQVKSVSVFLSKLEQNLEKHKCYVKTIVFFGSTIQKERDSYSDIDIMIIYDGDLPSKHERKKQYSSGDKIKKSIDGTSNLAPETEFSEDLVFTSGNYLHIDFRQIEEINKIFKKLKDGDCDSFYFLHCLQNGVITDKKALAEHEELIETIPEKARDNFIDSKKEKISQILQSMSKTVIRGDNVRYLELLLQNIHNVIDFYYVNNNKYPGKKKGLKEKLENFKNGNDLYDRFSETLKNAITNPEDSYVSFRTITSEVTGIDFNYDNND